MTRPSVPGLYTWPGTRVIADFTDGTHTLTDAASDTSGDCWYNAGSANATTRAGSLDSNGVTLTMEAGASTTYMSFAYAPSTAMDLSASDWLAVEIDYPEADGSYASQQFMQVQALVVGAPRTPKATYTDYVGQKSLYGTADRVPHTGNLLLFSMGELRAQASGGTFKPNTVTRIELRFVYNATTTGIPCKVRIKRIYSGRVKTLVILHWANMYDGVYDYAFATLAAAGLKGNISISAAADIDAAGKMTVAEVNEVYAAGWDIAVEQDNDVTDQPIAKGTLTRSGTTATFTPSTQQANPFITAAIAAGDPIVIRGAMQTAWNQSFASAGATCNASTGIITFTCAGTETTPATGYVYVQRTTQDELVAAFTNSRATIQSYGWTRGNDHCSWSGGQVSDLTTPWVEGMFTTGHGADVSTTPMQRCFDPRLKQRPARLFMNPAIMDKVTAATALGYVDIAEARGASILLIGHDLASGAGTGTALTMDSDEFATMINGSSTLIGLKQRVLQGRIHVITWSEYHRLLNGTMGRPAS